MRKLIDLYDDKLYFAKRFVIGFDRMNAWSKEDEHIKGYTKVCVDGKDYYCKNSDFKKMLKEWERNFWRTKYGVCKSSKW